MSWAEEDYLQLSGIQHFAFCRRQWALIHLEQLWAENALTAEGAQMHQRAHDESQTELRGGVLTVRGLRVASPTLGLSGACDVVEFHQDDERGVTLQGREGRWLPYPIEYKRGKPKPNNADELQLCAQAMCLEEMLCCEIAEGALFYGEPRRRTAVPLTDELRACVRQAADEMHAYAARGYTPRVKPNKGCKSCSLADACLPGLTARTAGQYIDARVREAAAEGNEP